MFLTLTPLLLDEKVNLPLCTLVIGEGAEHKVPASVRVTGPQAPFTLCREAILEVFRRFLFNVKLSPAAIHLLKNLSLATLGKIHALSLR